MTYSYPHYIVPQTLRNNGLPEPGMLANQAMEKEAWEFKTKRDSCSYFPFKGQGQLKVGEDFKAFVYLLDPVVGPNDVELCEKGMRGRVDGHYRYDQECVGKTRLIQRSIIDPRAGGQEG
jgi:hypothetical protein